MGKRFSPKKYEIICGVYSITNVRNNKKYIGKSENIYVRWDEHRKELNKGIHNNIHLQRSWIKYGEDAFMFEILEKCDGNDKAYHREMYWIDYYDSFKNGYNMNEGGTGGLGYRHTEENIKKMKEFQKDRMSSPKEREKLSNAHDDYKKPIVQVSLLDGSVTHWESENKAGRELDFQVSNIHTALKKENHYACDSLWFYQNEYNENLNIEEYI